MSTLPNNYVQREKDFLRVINPESSVTSNLQHRPQAAVRFKEFVIWSDIPDRHQSSPHLVRAKSKIVDLFSHLMSLFTPQCLLRSDSSDELVKRTKTQQHPSCENIHITHWPDVYQNVLPKPLFDQPELTSGEILADWTDFAAAHSGGFSPKMHSSFSGKVLIEVGSRSL